MKTILLSSMFAVAAFGQSVIEQTNEIVTKEFVVSSVPLIPTSKMPVVTNSYERIRFTYIESVGGVSNKNAPKNASVEIRGENVISNIMGQAVKVNGDTWTTDEFPILEAEMPLAAKYIRIGQKATKQSQVVVVPTNATNTIFVPFVPAEENALPNK